MQTLDEKDEDLLLALRRDSRTSLTRLAQNIGLSKSATHDRVRRLEERGLILGYTIVEPSSLRQIKAFMTIKLDPTVRDKDIVPLLTQKPGVEESHCLAGDIDILVRCACSTPDALSELREEIAGLDGVLTVHTRMIMNSR
ncbi:MAG: Lrp/AsnC family transcriptional regulator [Pseudomonadota bacterium]